MKYFITFFYLLSSLYLFSLEMIGVDSGGEPIILYENKIKSDNALLIIGGIHGDETDTTDVVNYLLNELDLDIKSYFIPSINPTLHKNNRRGYLREHLTTQGFVIPGSKLKEFNKALYYRTFYGNSSTYKNGISHYIDPNRDFIEKLLPSTRVLTKLIDQLKSEYKHIVILSFHGYMNGGRIYPEYTHTKDNLILVKDDTWNIAKAFDNASSFKSEKIYAPAIPILERFSGELIVYTSYITNVTAFDIELNSNEKELNKIRSLNGIKQIEEILLQQK